MTPGNSCMDFLHWRQEGRGWNVEGRKTTTCPATTVKQSRKARHPACFSALFDRTDDRGGPPARSSGVDEIFALGPHPGIDLFDLFLQFLSLSCIFHLVKLLEQKISAVDKRMLFVFRIDHFLTERTWSEGRIVCALLKKVILHVLTANV